MDKYRNSLFWVKTTSISILCFTIYITFKRLYYGVDLTDEAFYSGIPYEFYLGKAPFTGELNILQFPSFLLYPIFKMFFILNDGTDSVILFNRFLFFVFFIMVSIVIFIVLKRGIPYYSAFLIAFSCLVFIPNNIPALSYNTLGYGLFTVSLFLVYYSLSLNNRKNTIFFIAGITFGFSVISYPTIIIPYLMYSILLFTTLIKTDSLKRWFLFLLGSMLAASPIFLVLVKSGIEDISYFIQNINYVGAQGGDLQKIFNELLNWYSLFPNKILALLVVILVTFLNYKKSDLYSWSLLLLPILAYDYSAKLDIQQSLKFINNYIVFFPLLFLLHFRDKVVRKLFILIFIPSLFAGLTFIWSSSNGFYAAGLGFFPASLALSYIIVHLIHNRKTAIQSKQWLSILLPSIIIVLLIFMQNSVYRDEPIKELTAKVEFGPYKGLYTTKEKRDFLQTFSTDILSFSKHKSIFFYSHIPGGYLFSTSKPAGNTLWVFTYTKDFSVYSDYFYDYPKPEVVFRMKFMIAEDFLPITYQKDNVLNQFINNQYNIIHSNQYYDVLIENK